MAEGHGAASLYFLAQELIARHKRVDMIVGGESLERVFKPIEGKRLSQTIQIVTADGSLGERGSVMDALPEMVEKCGAQVMYAAASTTTLERIAGFCRERQIPAQVVDRGADGVRVRPLLHVRGARRAEGRQRLRQPAVVHRRSGVQPGARAVGSMALRRSDDAAHAP